jgi:hypothetical protein
MTSPEAQQIMDACAEAERRSRVSPLVIVRRGALSLQVCAPKSFTAEQVQAEANLISICGTEAGWQISDDPKLAPVPCADAGAERVHWMLVA